MSDFDVYGDEMPSVPPLDESAVEALLAGRTDPAAAGEHGLTAFVEDLQAAVDGPAPQATPQLAAFMAEGLSTEKGDLPVTAASNVPGPARQAAGLPTWRKRRMTVTEMLAALAAKLAGLGMAAKAALGLGMAAAVTTTAAAAGVLPDPAQHAVASVVNAVSPLDIPDGDDTPSVAADEEDPDGSTTTTSSTTVPGGDDEGTDEGTGVAANHGGCVSEVAHSANRGPGGEHGRAVSEVAKSDCGKGGDDDGGDDDEEATTTSTSTTTPGGDDETADSGRSSNRGHGNGGGDNSGPGHGNGNGGSGGNSGKGKN